MFFATAKANTNLEPCPIIAERFDEPQLMRVGDGCISKVAAGTAIILAPVREGAR